LFWSVSLAFVTANDHFENYWYYVVYASGIVVLVRLFLYVLSLVYDM